jgi:hypothetical protein
LPNLSRAKLIFKLYEIMPITHVGQKSVTFKSNNKTFKQILFKVNLMLKQLKVKQMLTSKLLSRSLVDSLNSAKLLLMKQRSVVLKKKSLTLSVSTLQLLKGLIQRLLLITRIWRLLTFNFLRNGKVLLM